MLDRHFDSEPPILASVQPCCARPAAMPVSIATVDLELRQQGFIASSTSSSETVAKELA
jgi:hypothetical protein